LNPPQFVSTAYFLDAIFKCIISISEPMTFTATSMAYELWKHLINCFFHTSEFWGMTLCIDVGYRRFGRQSCLHF